MKTLAVISVLFLGCAILYAPPRRAIITTYAQPAEGGTTSGSGSYAVGEIVTVSAIPNATWSFDKWSNGNTNPSVSFTAKSGKLTLVASFKKIQYGIINLVSEPINGGTTAGAGSYPIGQVVTISATPSPNWSFVRWQDNEVANSRNVTVSDGTLLMTASFSTNPAPIGTISCGAQPTSGGTVAGCGNYPEGTTVMVTAVPNANWRFVSWSDGNTSVMRSVQIPPGGGIINLTAIFEQYGNVTVIAEPSNGGTVSGSGSYGVGQTVSLVATPSTNWHFLKWQDGNTNRIRSIIVGPGSLIMTGTFVTNSSPGTASLNWPASKGATSYAVRWGTSSGVYGNSFNTSMTNATISGLSPNVTYYFAVQSISVDGIASKPGCEVAWKYPESKSCGL